MDTSNNSFSLHVPPTLQKDLLVLRQFDNENEDKLAIDKGELVITKGGFAQAPTRTVKNILQGGYNRNAVANYLAKTTKQIEIIAQTIQKAKNEGLTANYKEVKEFSKDVKRFATLISDVQGRYRKSDHRTNTKASKKLSELYNRVSPIRDDLKKKLKSVPQPQGYTKPVRDYEAMYAKLRSKNIRAHMRKGETAQDILTQAKLVEKHRVPVWKKVAAVAVFVFAAATVGAVLSFLTLPKLLLWNPVEYMFTGEVNSEMPLLWFSGQLARKMEEYFPKVDHHLENFAQRLIWGDGGKNEFTEERLTAFKQLSKHVKEIDLDFDEYISHDFDELVQMHKKDKLEGFSEEEIKVFKDLIKSYNKPISNFGFIVNMLLHRNNLKWVNDPKTEVGSNFLKGYNGSTRSDRLEYLKKYVSQKNTRDYGRKIQLNHMIELIDTLGKNKHVTIKIYDFHMNEPIKQALLKNGFKNVSEHKWKK